MLRPNIKQQVYSKRKISAQMQEKQYVQSTECESQLLSLKNSQSIILKTKKKDINKQIKKIDVAKLNLKTCTEQTYRSKIKSYNRSRRTSRGCLKTNDQFNQWEREKARFDELSIITIRKQKENKLIRQLSHNKTGNVDQTEVVHCWNMQKHKRNNRQQREQGITEKKKRPKTALSRTGLQIHFKQISKDRPRRKCSPMINRIHKEEDKHSQKLSNFLNNCNSDRVVRNTEQSTIKKKGRYYKKNKINKKKVEEKCSADKPTEKINDENLSNYGAIYVPKNKINKQYINHRLTEIIEQCDEQQLTNDLWKGMDIFQYYCKRIDKGLINASEELKKILIN